MEEVEADEEEVCAPFCLFFSQDKAAMGGGAIGGGPAGAERCGRAELHAGAADALPLEVEEYGSPFSFSEESRSLLKVDHAADDAFGSTS